VTKKTPGVAGGFYEADVLFLKL